MIRTREEIVTERNRAIESIEKLHAEYNDLRVELRDSDDSELKLELNKRIFSISHRLTRLRGMREALDFIINYDSNIDTGAYYLSENYRYNVE